MNSAAFPRLRTASMRRTECTQATLRPEGPWRTRTARPGRRAHGVLPAAGPEDAFPPLSPVADTAAVVRCYHHVALLEEVLVKGVVHRVVPLHVPAVVVLVVAVSMDPDDRRVLARPIEVLRNEEIGGDFFAIG